MATDRDTVRTEPADPLPHGVVVACRRDAGRLAAFALDGGGITPAQIASRLAAVPGVTALEADAPWHLPPGQVLRFAWLGHACVVHEPWGIEGRYWVEPDAPIGPAPDLAPLARVFTGYRPTAVLRWLDALTRPLLLRRHAPPGA